MFRLNEMTQTLILFDRNFQEKKKYLPGEGGSRAGRHFSDGLDTKMAPPPANRPRRQITPAGKIPPPKSSMKKSNIRDPRPVTQESFFLENVRNFKSSKESSSAEKSCGIIT